MMQALPIKKIYGAGDVQALLDEDFNSAATVIRLFLDQSKDEFTLRLKDAFKNDAFNKGTGVMRYRLDKPGYIDVLMSLGLTEKMTSAVNRRLVWSDVLVERLKGGRGSAIKGQTRGRGMEDFVEEIVRSVFGPDQVAVRGSFLGAKGQGSAKADFAIPSMEDPSILIETKAYGATGRKQSDALFTAEPGPMLGSVPQAPLRRQPGTGSEKPTPIWVQHASKILKILLAIEGTSAILAPFECFVPCSPMSRWHVHSRHTNPMAQDAASFRNDAVSADSAKHHTTNLTNKPN
jgi:hypothetical protein